MPDYIAWGITRWPEGTPLAHGTADSAEDFDFAVDDETAAPLKMIVVLPAEITPADIVLSGRTMRPYRIRWSDALQPVGTEEEFTDYQCSVWVSTAAGHAWLATTLQNALG